ncbi:hypothetical protein LWE61_05230 [Sphingobium sufflavum]|uniref:hypothetical protein n=1 Tax=Sphingobium sufflavum TaxID=1129547 RepID=UPI001F3CD9B9|nr:hypothetical protein [Sphingobium sufflavum]MCE7795962.1 hypothetical protein [Sphingobium sufflavum]
MPHGAMMMIRSDLIRRIDAIAATAGKTSLAALCEQVDAIRRIARQHRLEAVEGLASMIETATAYSGHGTVVLSYLDLMRDAVDCEDQDGHVRAAYTAALSLRLGA